MFRCTSASSCAQSGDRGTIPCIIAIPSTPQVSAARWIRTACRVVAVRELRTGVGVLRRSNLGPSRRSQSGLLKLHKGVYGSHLTCKNHSVRYSLHQTSRQTALTLSHNVPYTHTTHQVPSRHELLDSIQVARINTCTQEDTVTRTTTPRDTDAPAAEPAALHLPRLHPRQTGAADIQPEERQRVQCPR